MRCERQKNKIKKNAKLELGPSRPFGFLVSIVHCDAMGTWLRLH